jgi:hypothetical protein
MSLEFDLTPKFTAAEVAENLRIGGGARSHFIHSRGEKIVPRRHNREIPL